MRPQIRSFVEICLEHLDFQGPIYEFGALQVSTDFSDMRPFFPGFEYVGCDIIEGPGVDAIIDATKMTKLANESVGTILMLEMLEMCQDPIRAVQSAYRVLKPGGILLASSIGPSWPIEKYPPDYWRITPLAYQKSLFEMFPSGLVTWGGHVTAPGTVVGVGIKDNVDLGSLLKALNALLPKVVEGTDYWGEQGSWWRPE